MDNKDIYYIIKALKAIMDDEGYSNLVINQLISENHLVDHDSRSLRKITNGVIEHWLWLEYQVDEMAKKRMKKDVRYLLYSALYEIGYLDGRADHAVVNRYVGYAKKHMPYASGFVNALLRRALRNPVSLPPQPLHRRLSLQYSHPEWLVKKWLNDLGQDETEKMLEANLNEHPLYIRVNTSRYTRDTLVSLLIQEGVAAVVVDDVPFALKLVHLGGKSLTQLKTFQEGAFFVQDLSSMLVGWVCDPLEGNRVLDLCGAPGGKGTHIAELLKGSGQVVIRDIHPHKLALIKDNADRLQLTNVTVESGDALKRNPQDDKAFDVVLVDAPCSGLGIIGRKPEIKYRKTEEAIDALVKIQETILDHAATYVKNGGFLIYSTCTVEKRENECQVHAFLDRNPAFERVDLSQSFIKHWAQGEPYVSLRQSNGITDGFFIAKFQKKVLEV